MYQKVQKRTRKFRNIPKFRNVPEGLEMCHNFPIHEDLGSSFCKINQMNVFSGPSVENK